MPTELAIRQTPDRAHCVRLLEGAALPTADLTDDSMKDFFHVGPVVAPVGIVGMQLYGGDALLRSLMVNSEHRAQGLGHRLVERASNMLAN